MAEQNDQDTSLLDKDNNVQKMECKKYEKDIKWKCIPAHPEAVKRRQRDAESWKHASKNGNNICEKVAQQPSNHGQKSLSEEMEDRGSEHKRKLDHPDLAKQATDQKNTSEVSMLSMSFPFFAEPRKVKHGSPKSIKGRNAHVTMYYVYSFLTFRTFGYESRQAM